MQPDLKIYAVRHLEREGWGERIRLIHTGTKRRVYKEHGPMDRMILERLIRKHNFDLALLLGKGVMVLDIDGPNQGEFADLKSGMTSTTSRGEHRYFRTDTEGTNKIKYQGSEVDLLWNGLAAIPPNELITGQVRRWVHGTLRPEALPMFPKELIREEPKPEPITHIELPEDARLEGMRRWIRYKIARQGFGGDATTYKVAIKIMSVCETVEQGMNEILAWDRANEPPWSDTEQGIRALRYKLECARDYLQR